MNIAGSALHCILQHPLHQAHDDLAHLVFGAGFGPERVHREARAVGEQVEVILRTEAISLSSDSMSLDNCFSARLSHVIYLGGHIRYQVELGTNRVSLVEANRGDHGVVQEGSDVFVGWSARDALLVKL